ncbi:hypothetical protein [Paractinoplanes durhamensis]|uniref:hypothetical protein n=1 Tax=Paractinoplanes durhamensis TaxID=113563 RepID=UPI00363BA291
MNAVLRTQLRGVARRPARLLLTGLAVLAVSFVVYATVLAQTITERSVLNGLSGTPEAVDLVISNGTVTTGELAKIGQIPGWPTPSGGSTPAGRSAANTSTSRPTPAPGRCRSPSSPAGGSRPRPARSP